MYTYKTIIFEIDCILQAGKINADALDALNKLKQDGYTLCISTFHSVKKVKSILRDHKLEQIFTLIKSTEDSLKKVQHFKQILDDTACCSAIVVSQYRTDFEAAKEASCLFIAISNSNDVHVDNAPISCEYSIEALGNIYQLVQKINTTNRKQSRDILRSNKESRITLRIAAEEHMDEIRRLHEEETIIEMLGVVEMPDDNYLEDKNTLCYLILDEQHEFIGIVEFINISWKNRRAELSISMNENGRGKGYGYEAIMQILSIGFVELGLNRIWLRVLEYNTSAINCYLKAGFIQEGVCREESMRSGKFMNQIQMSILRKEWMLRMNIHNGTTNTAES